MPPAFPESLRFAAASALAVSLLTLGLGEALVLRTHRTADGRPGLSVRDLQLRFTGGYDSLFEARVRGEMRQYLADSGEVATLAAWARGGGTRGGYDDSVAGLLDDRCVRCHNSLGQASFQPLDSYERALGAVKAPSAPSLTRQLMITKVHLAGISLLLGASAGLCWLLGAPAFHIEWATRAGFSGLFLDFGSWWLMRVDLVFAWGRVLGNVLLALSLVWIAVAAFFAWYRTDRPPKGSAT